ncbi:helix-turn-helix transcriptional regulator [Halobacterium salinarum]|uniref:helix-turn-helix transcriptional regulator n=1 Tax=Halobacterium salinarum TaxID=2242 RepID=UPI0025572957|nr:hypothetical protein [Halobacterium salinarum]MDL0122860.1 hypothetical protein [Halobacterium salinarum]
MTESDARFREVLERRYEILQQLIDSPVTKPELVEKLETSRSTIDRGINDLVAVDCVTAQNGEYRATTAGHLALREHSRYRETSQAVQETTDLLNHLPAETGLDVDLLDGATVSMAEDHAPDQALLPTIDIFDRATRLRGLAPVVLNFYPNLLSNRLGESELTVEIVAETAVLSTLPDIPSLSGASLSELDGLTLYETGDGLPYALWLMDTPEGSYAGITAYESGGVAGVLINDTDAAVQWAQEQYEQYRENAQLVSVSEL